MIVAARSSSTTASASASANATRLSGTVASRPGCGVTSIPGDALGTSANARSPSTRATTARIVDVGGVFDSGLSPGHPARGTVACVSDTDQPTARL